MLLLIIWILVIKIFVFFFFNKITKKNKLLKEMEIFKVRERYQQQFIDNANMQYDSICKIRLDIKNQLSAVHSLISDGEYKSAMELIEKK